MNIAPPKNQGVIYKTKLDCQRSPGKYCKENVACVQCLTDKQCCENDPSKPFCKFKNDKEAKTQCVECLEDDACKDKQGWKCWTNIYGGEASAHIAAMMTIVQMVKNVIKEIAEDSGARKIKTVC